MPMMELDFKSQEQVYKLRKGFVAQQSLLTDVDAYEPSAADVFGGIG